MNIVTPVESAARVERISGHWAWPAVVAFAMLLAIVSGGSSLADSWAFLLFRLLCIGLFGIALLKLPRTRLAWTETTALVLMIAGVALVCLQLVPLPYGLFVSLPGREYVGKIFAAAGIPPQAMPMTLSPESTRAFLLALLPPIAFFLTLLTSRNVRWVVAAAVLAGSIANVFLGLAQRLQGTKSALYLYEITNWGSATGFFSNRNNFAMLLCVAIPLTWAVAHKLANSKYMTPFAAVIGGAVMMVIILMGLAAANSRSGLLLGMLALTLSTFMVLVNPPASSRSSSRQKSKRLALLAILGGAFVIGQFGMSGILRIVDTDPLNDIRSDLRRNTLHAASDYFPVGSGFGTFSAVYAMHEPPKAMMSEYVNHAHNEWLELWMEGGLPAAMLLAAFFVFFAVQSVRVWTPQGPYADHVLPRAASIAVLVLLLHSFAEFPLRMPALACIFAAMIAILMAPPPKRQSHRSGPRRRREPVAEDLGDVEEAAERPVTAPVITTPPVFRVPRGDRAVGSRDDGGGARERQTRL